MSQKDRTVPKDWIQAFACLREYIEELPKDERVFLEPFTSGQTKVTGTHPEYTLK